MGPSDEIVKRAEDEAEVIKLIYGDAVVHCKTRDCWKQFQHLELRVRLGPSTTETTGSSVELDIVCPPLYPLEPPKIAILKPIGVTKTETAELLQRLNDRIGHVSGSELIYDLCMETQNFLRTKRTSAESNEETSGSRPPTSQLQPAAIRTTTRQNSVDSRQSVFLPEEEEPVEVRAEDEQKCRLEKTLKRIGPLGDSIKVELISKAGQVVDVSRILNSAVQRKPLHQFATEWLAWDGHRPVLVTEFRFEHKLLRRDKNVTNKLVAFEKSLRTFASQVLKHLSLPIDDEFLTTYSFCHVHRASNVSTLFDVRLLLGQYIELGSRTLGQEGVLQGLIKSSKSSLLPQLANHLICGLKSLHEGRVAHGGLDLNTIWVRADNTFFLSDHHLLSDILHFCQSFAHITDDGDRKRRHSIHALRLQDIRDFGRILTEISHRNKSLSVDQGCLDDFVAQCNLPDAHIQALSDHPFLYLSCPTIPSTEDGSASTFVPITSMKNSGRLLKEYHVISFLGRGGFGEVWLARNKLDSNNYAIKRIPLSGISWKQVERIKNEVLLFSKITDDHIVRYFSSWVESTTLERTESSSEPISQTISDDLSLLPSKLRDLEDEADGGTRVDQKKTDDSTTADSSSSSSSGGFGFFRGPHTTRHKPSAIISTAISHAGSDLSVIFADEKMDGRAVIPLSDLSEEANSDKRPNESQLSYLCLQMEWCKYGTLRTLIDEGELYENSAMIWRICKETILGLDCLHRYKLIHRDIKPSNLFLTADYRVKLGDFGLATRALFQPEDEAGGPDGSSNPLQVSRTTSLSKDAGTHFYIPPEGRRNEKSGTRYDQKFDIYSLGVVLFESICRPPATRLERVRIMEQLQEMKWPADTFDYLPPTHRKAAETLLRWCLNESPTERPSTTELLESGLIPHISSEEEKFRKTCTQVAQNLKHRLRPQLLDVLFNAPLPPTIGNNFDRAFCTDVFKRPFPFFLCMNVIKELADLFRLHGYECLQNEELVPCTNNFPLEGESTSLLASLCEAYRVMDREGIVLSFPKSFRQGFARLCAHVGAARMKAFSIGRVFSQASATLPSHPVSRWECEADVIGPRESSSQLALEILQLTTEIFRLLYVPESTKWRLILNHRSILTAVCLHHGINDEYTMASVLNLLYEYSSQTRKDAYSNLVFGLTHQCGLSEAKATEMLAWLNLPLSNSHQLRDRLRPLLRSKNDLVRKGAEEGLAQLDFLYHGICHKLAPQLCLNFQLSFVYQPLVFSDGLLFSLRVEFTESKSRSQWCPILSGGRYDSFLAINRQINSSIPVSESAAYGFNLAVENASNFPFFIRKDRRVPSCVVLVAVSSLDYFSAAAALAAQLRAQAISTDLWEEVFTLGGSLHEYCLDRSVQFVLQLVSLEDVVVYANSQFEEASATATEFRIVQNRSSAAEAIKYVVGQSRDTKEEKDVKTTDSSNQPFADNKNLPTTASMANVNLKSCSSKNLKHTHHQRKKIESHAYAILTPLVKRFNSRQTIDAVITDLPVDILTAIANLDRTLGHDQIFTEFQLIAKQSPKHKMDVMLLFDELEVFFEQQPNATNTVVVLLTPSVNESFYRLLM